MKRGEGGGLLGGLPLDGASEYRVGSLTLPPDLTIDMASAAAAAHGATNFHACV